MSTLTFTIDQRPAQLALPPKKPWGRALVVSGAFHLLVLLAILLAKPITVSKEDKFDQPTIHARLYVPSIPAKPEKVPIPPPPETPVEPIESKPVSLPKKQAAKTTSQVQREPANAPKEETQTPSEAQIKQTLEPPSTAAPEPVAKEPNTTPSQRNQRAGNLNLSPKSGAMDFLAAQQEQAIIEESRRAAREFREKKNSPDLVDTRKGKQALETDRRPTKRVNCASTTNKTLALLSSFAGGTLTCSESAEHDKFIEARLNKEQSK